MSEQNPADHKKSGASDPEKKNRSRYILVNTVSSYGRDIVDTIAFLVLIPFIIHTLGKESFGLWSLIWAFLAIFELADLGFAASVIKYVADARGKNDFRSLKNIVCTLFWIYAFLGGAVGTGVLISLLFFNKLFQVPPDQLEMANAVLVILGVRSALYLPLGMFRGVLVGFQKLNVANAYKVFSSLLYLASVLIILPLVPDIRVLALLNAITGLIPMFAMMIHVKKVMPEFTLNPKHFQQSLMRKISSFSIYFSLTQVAGMIATRSDTMVIKLFLPLEMVAIYSIGMRLSEHAGMFCSHLTRALSPVFAELHGANDQLNAKAALYRGSKLTIAFATPLLLGLAILSEPLILAWTGPSFIKAVPVCQWLVAAAMITIIHGNTVNLLAMGGHQKYTAICLVAGQIINLALSFILIIPLGIVGVSMATFIASVPIYIGFLQVYASRMHGMSLLDFYRATLLPSLIPALAMAGLLVGVLNFINLTNLVEVAILQTIGMIFFTSIYWLIGFNREERAYFWDKIRRALTRRKSKSRTTTI
ncbi:MAG: flippase [Pseudomonadota bacterium]